MIKEKIGIVILNYLAYQDTIECVESLALQSFQHFEVLIVDNYSTNNSFRVLSERFATSPNVHVISTPSNLGFAKGNNVGISYFKEKNIFNVLVINGDVIFTDNNYLQILASMPIDSSVAMIGTEIMSKDGKNQNPISINLNSQKDLIFPYIKLNLLSFLVKTRIYYLIKKIFNVISKEDKPEYRKCDKKFKILNSQKQGLHGSAIFFTENYTQKYIGFYPDTFLYFEEDFLTLLCQKLNLKQMYVPSISIFHKEDASSDLLNDNNDVKAYLFKIKYAKKNLRLVNDFFKLSLEDLKKRMSST